LYDGRQTIVRCIREVKIGEEITATYGPRYGQLNTKQRQEFTLKGYDFVCMCEVVSTSIKNQKNCFNNRHVHRQNVNDLRDNYTRSIVLVVTVPHTSVRITQLFVKNAKTYKLWTRV
jgi:hypothetical protein